MEGGEIFYVLRTSKHTKIVLFIYSTFFIFSV